MNEMYVGGYKKVQIISCTNPDYWYFDKIGKNIFVREVNWPSAYVEAKNGYSALKSDLKFKTNKKP